MQTVLIDFNERVEEIEEYFTFLDRLIQHELEIVQSQDRTQVLILEDRLAKTLKANGFLLLYNLVESSMRNAVEEIFSELHTRQVSFDQISVGLRKVILQNLKNCSVDKLHSQISHIAVDIINISFSSEELFSGNIDRRKITEIARQYGFSDDTDYEKTKHGKNLVIIKSKRNDLAHGNKSFGEVGRDVSIRELIQYKNETIESMRAILQNIEEYLTDQQYLDSR